MRAPRPTTTAALRGSLPAASLDARAIGRLAKNPQCQRLAGLTLVGSSPGKAMEHVFAPGFEEKQSKFAIAKGTRFERVQVEHGGARLIASLQEAGILGSQDVSFRNIE